MSHSLPTPEIRAGLQAWIDEIRADGLIYFTAFVASYGAYAILAGFSDFQNELPGVLVGVAGSLATGLALKIVRRTRESRDQRAKDVLRRVATYEDMPVTGRGTYALSCLALLLQESGQEVSPERVLRHVLTDLRREGGVLEAHEIESAGRAAHRFHSVYVDAGILRPRTKHGALVYCLDRPLARQVLLEASKTNQLPSDLAKGWRRR